MEPVSFAERIRKRYPEGLTGIFAIGGTRTAYILEKNRHAENPGRIEDFSVQGGYLQERYCQFIDTYLSLGGQNLIITASSFRGFGERGEEYTRLIAQELLRLINPQFQTYYHEREIDPYFVGIDTFLHLPESSAAHQMGQELTAFQKSWPYKEGRPKLVWEIASIPLFSFWKLSQGLTAQERQEFDAELNGITNLDEIHRFFYKKFSWMVYGTDLPMPHFYLGTNKSGDLKWRSPMPIALTGGEYMRMFYTPYPSLFITHDTLQAILEDLAFKDRFHSLKTDYDGRYTSELAQAEYDRILNLSGDPATTVGFSRRVAAKGEAR